MANISFYGSHNAAISVEENGKVISVIEIERFLNTKNSGYARYIPAHAREYALKKILKYIEKEYGITEFENCFYLSTHDAFTSFEYTELIPAKNYIPSNHHESHAACGFYQSDFEKALIVSFDGGGNDGFFNVYIAKDRKNIEIIKKINVDLGVPYMAFGQVLKDIKKEDSIGIGNLVYAGKLMGLCSYGNLRNEWIPYFEEYYESKPSIGNFMDKMKILGEKINVDFHGERIDGQVAYDIAKSSQIAFENQVIKYIQPFLNEYQNYPLIIVGGCGLNILLNTRLKKGLTREVFIPPNPNDCGIASGMLLNHIRPTEPQDLTYSGLRPLDEYCLMSYVEERRGKSVTHDEISEFLKNGEIVGVVRDTAEHGPRALGNRSILCNPFFGDMKDTLNKKVKNREWYRPFAPVCKLEDVSKYFDFEGESRWMSFCPTVKNEWRDTLKSITHVDGTARVQTVTREQNEWLYDLITEFEKKTGFGVLLNTSFNIAGKPIVPTYQDALKLFDNTAMDKLVLDEFLFKK